MQQPPFPWLYEEVSAGLTVLALRPRSSSVDTLNSWAMRGIMVTSGQDTSFSHLLTAWGDTPSRSATCSWVMPAALRSAIMRLPKVSVLLVSVLSIIFFSFCFSFIAFTPGLCHKCDG